MRLNDDGLAWNGLDNLATAKTKKATLRILKAEPEQIWEILLDCKAVRVQDRCGRTTQTQSTIRPARSEDQELILEALKILQEIQWLVRGAGILRDKQVALVQDPALIHRVKQADQVVAILRDLKAAPAVEDADKFSGTKFLEG